MENPELINLDDYERLALERLQPLARDYYRSGADDEITLSENRAAFQRLRLRYRVLVDVAARDLGVELLGHRLAMPILAAPTAFHQLACPEGETATVRAAGRAGTIFTLSTLSNRPMEEVAAAASGPWWFQLYVYRDRGATEALVARAEEAGASALVLTVDAPLLGRRERDIRNRFHLPPGLRVSNLVAAGYDGIPEGAGASGLANYVASFHDPSLSWKDVDWLASRTRLPILIKGVVHPADGRRALDHGVAGVVVSNHGGRQLDTAIATIDALPAVVEAIAGRVPVLLDGGIRRGTDVVKALARGADAVLVGRPLLWGLAVGGEEGARRVLALLAAELDLALALCGCRSPKGIAGLGLLR